MNRQLWHRLLAIVLAGLLLIAQPGPCPCWLYTLWRIDAAQAEPHAEHRGHDVSRQAPTGGRASSDGDTLRFGVQPAPVPALVAGLLETLARRTIHWRLLCISPVQAPSWRPALDPPPPRLIV